MAGKDYPHFGVPGMKFAGRQIDYDVEDHPLDMKISRRRPVKANKDASLYNSPVYPRPKKEMQEYKPYETKKWVEFAKYERKTYQRKALVKFSYTTRTVFENQKLPENFSNKATNAIVLKNTSGMTHSELDAFMRQINARKVSYISRDEAAVEPVPKYLDSSSEVPIYTMMNGPLQNLSNTQAIRVAGSDSFFSFILSPEDPSCDLTSLTAKFVDKILNHIEGGSPSFWFAANHYNTPHPHAHLIVAKTDKDTGKELYIPKYYSVKKMSEDLSECLTDLMGCRTWVEENEARNIKSRTIGYTDIDKKIYQSCKADSDGNLSFSVQTIDSWYKEDHDNAKRRIRYLKSRGYCVYDKDSKAWLLKRGFDCELKKDEYMTLFGLDYLDADKREKYIVHEDTKGEKGFTGKLLDFRRPEAQDARVVLLIEDRRGNLHFYEDKVDTTRYSIIPNMNVELEKSDRGLKIRTGYESGRGGL